VVVINDLDLYIGDGLELPGEELKDFLFDGIDIPEHFSENNLNDIMNMLEESEASNSSVQDCMANATNDAKVSVGAEGDYKDSCHWISLKTSCSSYFPRTTYLPSPTSCHMLIVGLLTFLILSLDDIAVDRLTGAV